MMVITHLNDGNYTYKLSAGNDKIALIKAVRNVLGLSVGAAKDYVDDELRIHFHYVIVYSPLAISEMKRMIHSNIVTVEKV